MKMRIGILSLLLLLPSFLVGQGVDVLPDDPRILKGTIPNGFSYYLIENDLRQGYADFYLIRKVGEVHESEGEFGFNSIISEMGVKGTRNFPSNTVLTYFDHLGLDRFSDFRIVNGYESSHYCVENVPVAKSVGVVDSTLLILYNWAVGINLDEEEVETGKRYYKNLMADHYRGFCRSELVHEAKLMERGPVDVDMLIDDVDGYRAKDLRSFYYKWFTPERMALVVTGDFDKGALDSKIKSLFQALPRFLEKPTYTPQSIVAHDEPLVCITSNKDASYGVLSVSFTANALPQNLRGTAVPFVEEYMGSMMRQLIFEKIIHSSKVSPFSYFCKDVSFGNFMESSWVNALKIDIVTSSNEVQGVLDEIISLLYSIKQNGFSGEDCARGKDLYFKELDYSYNWRIFTHNRVYANRAADNFLKHSSLASVEMKKEYMDLASQYIGVEQFNAFVSSYFRSGDNCIVTYTHPGSSGICPDSLAVTLENGNGVPIPKYRPLEHIVGERGGTIVGEYTETALDAKVWTLSNGATVVYKRTQNEPNKFVFEAVSKGGLSLMDSRNKARNYVDEIAALSLVGGVSYADFLLYKKNGKILLDKKFDLNTSSLSGRGYSANVETFMKMVNLHFLPAGEDQESFRKYRKIKSEMLNSRQFIPEEVFKDSVSTRIYHESQYVSTPSEESFNQMDYQSAISFVSERFSNAADFCFVIVGDLDEIVLKDLVSKYIASIPGNPLQKEHWNNVPIYLRKYDYRRVWEMEMDYTRNLYNMTLVSPSEYQGKPLADMSLVSEVITKRVTSRMKDKGCPVKVESTWVKFPEEFFTHSISSVTKDFDPEWESALLEILKELSENGATDQEVNNAKNVLAESYKREQKENLDFWKEQIINRFIYGKDMYTRYSEYISGSTVESVNRALCDYLDGSIKTTLILRGIKNDDKHNSN